MCDFETRQQLLSSPLIQSFADFTDAEGRQPTGGLLCYVLCAITIANTKFSELSLFSWYNFRIPLKTKTHLRSWVLIDCDLGNMIKSTVFCSTSLTLHIFPVAKNQFYKKRTKAALSVESTAAWAGEFERGWGKTWSPLRIFCSRKHNKDGFHSDRHWQGGSTAREAFENETANTFFQVLVNGPTALKTHPFPISEAASAPLHHSTALKNQQIDVVWAHDNVM